MGTLLLRFPGERKALNQFVKMLDHCIRPECRHRPGRMAVVYENDALKRTGSRNLHIRFAIAHHDRGFRPDAKCFHNMQKARRVRLS